MNILQILPEMEVGGVERGAVDLAGYLAANGHKSVVVSGPGRLVRRLLDAGTKHYNLPVGKKSPLTIFLMIREVSRIIIRENIEIVHARSRVPAIIGFAAAKLTHKIFITTAHGYYNTAVTSRPMSWGRFVIVASQDMAKHMMDDFGTPYDRIRLIPRGVNLDEFKFTPLEKITDFDRRSLPHVAEGGVKKKKDFVIGIVSRITPLKGHADLFRAVAIIFRKIPNIKVLVVGDSPISKPGYKEELEVLARRLGIGPIVDFMGSREDIPAVLSKLDVLVLPTRTPEAFGRVIIEAQAAGVPVVAAKVGGITDIIKDGENGLLVPPEDPQSIADALLKLYKDRGLGRSLALKARQIVEEKYSLQSMVEKTVNLYEEALRLRKILVIKISALGDVILSVPSLKAIRKKFPSAIIKALTGPVSGEALKGCPYINEKIIYEHRLGENRLKNLLRFGAILRREDFDIVVDLQNNRVSHILAFLTMADSRYGYDNGKWSFLLNKRVKDARAPIDPVSHQFRTLNLLGIEYAGEMPELWPSVEDKEWADNFLRENWIDERRILAGINIASSMRWQSKRWDADRIAELCDGLAGKYDMRTVLTGTAEDMDMAKEVVKLSGSKPIVAVGKTGVMQLAALIGRLKVYITTDSAPLHIAAGMKVPVIALFGPTDPARHMPKAENAAVLRSDTKCSPCYKPFCGKRNNCMRRIKSEDVLAVIEKYLTVEPSA